MKISKNKASELYQSVFNEVMDARIRVKSILDKTKLDFKTKGDVDDVLYDLCSNAPQIAIDNFKIKTP